MARPRIEKLRLAQADHFAALDPLLPQRVYDRAGQLLSVRGTDRGPAAGVVGYDSYGPGALPSLWSAREVWTLHPVLAPPVAPGLDALLDEWAAVLGQAGSLGEDSACLLSWPSRDADATKVLLAHGFQPLSVLAVRTDAPPLGWLDTSVTVRRAEPADLPSVIALSMLELAYSAKVGAAVLRPDAEAMKHTALSYRLGSGAPIWLAERNGSCVGMIECALTDVEEGPDAFLRPGKWAYLNCLSVLPEARGSGVGSTLVDFAHRELSGTVGWYLYYNPPNPLSSVFWPRHGYRPLWTLWEVRPAGALR